MIKFPKRKLIAIFLTFTMVLSMSSVLNLSAYAAPCDLTQETVKDSGGKTETEAFRDVISVNGTFYTVTGTTGKVYKSTDGSTWTYVSTIGCAVSAIAYGDGKFVATDSGCHATVYYSTDDGATWTPKIIDTDDPAGGRYYSNTSLSNIIYANNGFAAVGSLSSSYACIYFSSDGISWTRKYSSGDPITSGGMIFNGIAYGDNTYVAVGFAGANSARIFTSSDGASWTRQTAPENSGAANGVSYCNGKFMVGCGNTILSSANGEAPWNSCYPGASGIAYGNGCYYAVGTGSIYKSTNGTSWSNDLADATKVPSSLFLYSVCAGSGYFLVCGANGSMFKIVPNNNTVPTFISNSASLIVNSNSTGNDLKDILHASDTDSGQTLTWTQNAAPNHGSLNISGAAASSGDINIIPGGTITYTPAPDYTGTDSFTIKIDDGRNSSTRTVTVVVRSPLAYGVNLTVNGDAQSSDSDYIGWSDPGWMFYVATPLSGIADPQSPNGGNVFYYYSGADGSNSDSMTQIVDVSGFSTDIDHTHVYVDLTAQARKFSDTSSDSIKLELLDSSYNVIKTYEASGTSINSVWDNLEIKQMLEAGTSKLRISLEGTVVGSSDYCEFDGVSLVLSKDIAAPTGLSWDSTTPGLAKWDTVNDTLGYTVQLKKNGNNVGDAKAVTGSASCDFSSLIAANGVGTYTFSVVAKGNGSFFYDSPVTTSTAEYKNLCSPSFVGSSTTMNVGDTATDISSLLHASDSDSGTLTWTQETAPGHGTLSITGVTASSGGSDIAPGGTIIYTPETGYLGTDSFTIKVSDGIFTSTRTITLTIADTTAPAGEITIATKSWDKFLNTISFGLFFKDNVGVTITGADNGGIKSIQYYESASALTLDDVKALTDTSWSTYSSALSLTAADAQKFVIYAKLTDNAGNVTYLSSDGAQFDTTGPSISTDYAKGAASMNVTVTDGTSGLDAASVAYAIDGGSAQSAVLDQNGQFTIPSLKEGRYDVAISAKDIAGNSSSTTVHVVSLYNVTFSLYDGCTGDALSTQTIEYGSPAAAPADPTRTGFVFNSWDKGFNDIKANTTVNATWNIGGITAALYNGTYDKALHDAVTVTGTLAGDTVTYSTNGTDFSPVCPSYTDAGSYAVYVKVARSGCTTWESGLKTAQIGRAAGSIAITSDISKIYDGTAVSDPTVSKNSSGDVTISYYKDNSGSMGSAISSAPSQPGTYWVKAYLAEDKNYFSAKTENKFTINYAAITGSVSIQNTVNTGDTVSAAVSRINPNGAAYSYAWELNGTPISGETGSTYTVKESDYGKTLTAVLNSTGYYTGSITSNSVVIGENAAPTGEIAIAAKSWDKFLNTISFGLFFKDNVGVTITGTDKGGSGLKNIQYYKSASALALDDVKALTDASWSAYSSALSLTATDAQKFVIYAKLTDNAGNVTYLSSDGAQFDTTGPSVSSDYAKGAASMNVTVADGISGVDAASVTYAIDGGSAQSATLDQNGQFTIPSLKEGRYDVVVSAKDTVGNGSSATVHVVSLYKVTFSLYDGYTGAALKTEAVEYGSPATAPAGPTRAGFAFNNWDKDFNDIKANTTVNATWNIGGITATPYNGTYDKASHDAVTVTGTLVGDTVTYSTNGTDFSSACPSYTDAGSYPVYVKVARSGYTTWESGKQEAEIKQKPITSDMIAAIASAEHSGKEITPVPVVSYGSNTLQMNTDYTVSYTNNKSIGLASVNIAGIGNYSDVVSKNFAIYAKSADVNVIGTDTPPVTAANIDDLYIDSSVYTEDDKRIEDNGGSVNIQLSVTRQADSNAAATDQSKIQAIAPGKTIGLYLDLELTKTVTNAGEMTGTTTTISHVNGLLKVVIPIPADIKGKGGIALYRVHQGVASVIPIGKDNAVDGEYCTIDADNFTLYVNNFSTYAIGYSEATNGSTAASGTSSSGNTTTPDTGNKFPLFTLIGIMAGSVICLVLSLNCRRKNRFIRR